MISEKTSIGVKGSLRFTKYKPAFIFENSVYRLATLEEVPLSSREILWQGPAFSNLVVVSASHGLNLIAQRLIGLSQYDVKITQAKIGTGSTAPTDGDTDLEAMELDGIIVANQSHSLGEAFLQFFISNQDLANGTYYEFGIFCGDQLFARSLISPSFTKATNEDVGIDYTITFTN